MEPDQGCKLPIIPSQAAARVTASQSLTPGGALHKGMRLRKVSHAHEDVAAASQETVEPDQGCKLPIIPSQAAARVIAS